MTANVASFVYQAPMVCPGHNRCVVEMQYSTPNDEGVFLISASLDGKPMLRDGETGDWIGTFEGHKGAVWGACMDADGLVAATGAADFTARVWDATTGECRSVIKEAHICKSVAFDKEVKLLLTTGVFKTANVYDLSRPEEAVTKLPSGACKFGRFVGDTTDLVLCGGAEDRLVVWDTRSGAPAMQAAVGAQVRSGELRREGRTLTLVAGDSSVQFWDVERLQLLRKHAAPVMTESASLHPARDKYVLCGQDMLVRLYDYETGEELEFHRGHHGPVMAVRFAPDGESYASGADDGTIRIWQTQPSPNDIPGS